MAKSKRQKKKQAKKQTVKKLKSVGYTEKQAKRLYKSNEAQKKLKEIERREKINAERRRRTKELQALGFTPEQRKKLRSVGKEKYQAAIEKKKRQNERAATRIKKPKAYGGIYLVLLWRDRSQFTDDSTLQAVMESAKDWDIEEIVDNINFAIGIDGGEIGEYRVVLTDSLSRAVRTDDRNLPFYTIYVGTATRYHHFLTRIAAIIAGLYDKTDKLMFMQEVYLNLEFVNEEAAKQFKTDFKQWISVKQ